MLEVFIVISWIMAVVLGIMWLFLPWIIIFKINEIVEELRRLNSSNITKEGGV